MNPMVRGAGFSQGEGRIRDRSRNSQVARTCKGFPIQIDNVNSKLFDRNAGNYLNDFLRRDGNAVLPAFRGRTS